MGSSQRIDYSKIRRNPKGKDSDRLPLEMATTYRIRGKTYDYREDLKYAGARWNPGEKCWQMTEDPTDMFPPEMIESGEITIEEEDPWK